MGLSLQNLRDRFRKATGTDLDDIGDPDTDLYLNSSWWELQEKVNLREREFVVEFTLTAGTRTYSVSNITSFNSIVSASIRYSDQEYYSLLAKKEYEDLQQRQSNDDTDRDTPQVYARFNTDIYFWPVPDEDYVVQLQIRKTLADIGSTGPAIPQVWHEFVLYGAIFRYFMDLGEQRRAMAYRSMQESLAVTTPDDPSKERLGNSYSGITTPRRRYP